MKTSKKILLMSFFIIAGLMAGNIQCQAKQNNIPAVKSVKVKNKKKIVLYQGNKYKIKQSIPSLKNKKIVWKSSNKKVLLISSKGIMKTKKIGKSKVIAWNKGKKTKVSFTVKVKQREVNVSKILFDQNNVRIMEYGERRQLVANVLPSNATNKGIEWKSLNNSIATVDQNGVVTAKRPSENVDIIASSKEDNRKFAVWHISITANRGYITKQILDSKKLDDVNKLMIVSHPDDELFWGGGHLLQDKYFVVCVTNDYQNDERKNEFIRMMKTTGEECLVLDYPDSRINVGSMKKDIDLLTTSQKGLKKDLTLLLSYKKWDEVVTHNPDGEYGKYNHQKVSQFVTECYKEVNKNLNNLYYFGKFYWGEVPGEQLPQNIVDKKYELIKSYIPTAAGAVKAFGHMLPYENWIEADKW